MTTPAEIKSAVRTAAEACGISQKSFAIKPARGGVDTDYLDSNLPAMFRPKFDGSYISWDWVCRQRKVWITVKMFNANTMAQVVIKTEVDWL